MWISNRVGDITLHMFWFFTFSICINNNNKHIIEINFDWTKIWLVILIFRLMDAYRLKIEYFIYIISWTCIIVSMPLYSHLSISFLSYFSVSPASITLLGLVAILISSSIPLYLIILEKVAGTCVVDAKKYQDFINLLQSRHFRYNYYFFYLLWNYLIFNFSLL